MKKWATILGLFGGIVLALSAADPAQAFGDSAQPTSSPGRDSAASGSIVQMLKTGAGVTTPIGLLGLIVAAVLVAYLQKLRHARKQLETLPENERAAAADTYLTRYKVSARGLSGPDKVALIQQELRSRLITTSALIVVGAVTFLVCFALTIHYMAGQREPTPTTPPKVVSFAATPAAVTEGEQSRLSWEVAGALNTSIDHGVGAVAPKGELLVTPKETLEYTLSAMNGAGSDSRKASVTVRPKPPVTLTALSVHFHTNDEDKDDDTHVAVTVSKGDRVLASWQQSGKEKYPNGSDHTKGLALNGQVLASDLSGAAISVSISPNGNDTWRFGFSLSGTFSDGKPYSFNGQNHELNQDRRTVTATLP